MIKTTRHQSRRSFLKTSVLALTAPLIGTPQMSDAQISEPKASPLDYRDNLFTLVYAGALTKNVRGEVNIHPVSYVLHGLRIAGNVYTPRGYTRSGTYPAVVIAHPNGGVKEQTAGLYAQKLAEQGFITLAMDAAYQGASAGSPRQMDLPSNRIEDIHGAADFLSNFPGVDPERMGLFGICGGGGYALAAAATDKRFKSAATLSLFNTGRVRRNGFQDSQRETVQKRLTEATHARALEAKTGEVIYAGDANLTDSQIEALPYDLYRQGYHYYWRTNAHPGSTFKYTMSSLIPLMRWDATDQIELINVPLLMIAGSAADSLYMSEDAFSKATGTSDKTLIRIEGAKHIETYWVPEYVETALSQLEHFYNRTLAT